MFESLGERLQNALHKIKGYGKINEDNISDMMREIRLALLEADVNYTVVKEFTNNVKEKALGEEVQRSLKPGDLFVKIVKDELTALLGGEQKPLNLVGNPAILMLVGLQGSGKTTAIGKLSNLLRKKHSKKPHIVREKIVELVGNLPRVELFAREKVDGWVCLVNEIDGLDINEAIKNIKNID